MVVGGVGLGEDVLLVALVSILMVEPYGYSSSAWGDACLEGRKDEESRTARKEGGLRDIVFDLSRKHGQVRW
jgi:hypothetical protein